jgi:hypothetical protein
MSRIQSCGSQSTYIVYLEYHSVCPLVRIGTPPPPLSIKRGHPPPPIPRLNRSWPPRVHTRLLKRGWESRNSDDWRKSLALCILCAVVDTAESICEEKTEGGEIICICDTAEFSFLNAGKQGEAAFTVLSHGLFRGVRSRFSRVNDTEDLNSSGGEEGGHSTKQCCGSMTFGGGSGSGSSDPCH